MRCARAKDLFSSYLESEMDVSTCVRFEQHLAECPKCKAEYDRFNAAVVMMDEVSEVNPPADFHASVMARVEQARETVGSPVKWWRIDWQHVFTLRVPARAAAFAAAALVMVGVTVQVTPVGTGVMNVFGLQKVSPTIGEDADTTTAPPWTLKSNDVAYDMSGSGLLIIVTSQMDAETRVYTLRLQSKSEEPVEFSVNAGDQAYDGSVVRNQDSMIHVPVGTAQGLAVARVDWNYGGLSHSQYVFLPQRFDPSAHAKRRNMLFENMTASDLLRKISKDYGVVILASGDLTKRVPYAYVESGNPVEALFHGVEESGANMKQEVLAPSIYVVEPAK